jgi:hypothetical protein
MKTSQIWQLSVSMKPMNCWWRAEDKHHGTVSLNVLLKKGNAPCIGKITQVTRMHRVGKLSNRSKSYVWQQHITFWAKSNSHSPRPDIKKAMKYLKIKVHSHQKLCAVPSAFIWWYKSRLKAILNTGYFRNKMTVEKLGENGALDLKVVSVSTWCSHKLQYEH